MLLTWTPGTSTFDDYLGRVELLPQEHTLFSYDLESDWNSSLVLLNVIITESTTTITGYICTCYNQYVPISDAAKKNLATSFFRSIFWSTSSTCVLELLRTISHSWLDMMYSSLAGPILLEDYHLIEKLAQFDRERIPERVVHARGASAKGFFEVTHDVSHLTCADFLRAPGVQTPVIVRFSTVVHERGSPETLRDPRGFAVKFYTREVLMTNLNLLP